MKKFIQTINCFFIKALVSRRKPVYRQIKTKPINQLEAILDSELLKSRQEKPSDFMSGWIAALMHVKVNLLNRIK